MNEYKNEEMNTGVGNIFKKYEGFYTVTLNGVRKCLCKVAHYVLI